MSLLADKVVAITGGAGLIGQSFTKALIGEGARVIILEKNVTLAKEFISQLDEREALQCNLIEMDITSVKSVETAIAEIKSKYEKLDAIVNNAYPRNQNYGAHFFDVSYQDFCENLSLNVGGYFLCCQQFAKYFKEQGKGNIVNIGSIYGCVAPDFEIYEEQSFTMPVEYAAIKSSLIHLTKYMAKLFKGMNIKVNCLSPGGVYDNHNKKFKAAYDDKCLNKGLLDPSDLNGALVFLLSEQSEFINGQNIVVDDGFVL